jgi:replicative DNA helicase
MDISNDINTEFIIVNYLLKSADFTKKVLPYLDPDYFQLLEYQKISKVLKAFYLKYTKLPPISALVIYFKEKDKTISEDGLKTILGTLKTIHEYSEEDFSQEFLMATTEQYFRKRALFNAIVKAEDIYQNKPNDVNSIPDVIQKALQICFDTSIGHDYFENAEEALDYYHTAQIKYPTHLERLNEVTGGGFSRGKLNVILGQPGGGKTRFLVDICSHYVKSGLNCLFITLEISKMDIRQRFDANIMDIGINEFPKIDKERFNSKVKYLKSKTYGKLIIEHYAANTINCNHLKVMLDELKAKKNFVPDVICVDYIALMLPTYRGKDSYEIGKSVSAELKQLFDETNAIGFAPNQLNRGGWNTSEVMMSNIADSAGIMHNADFCASITGPDELLDENKFLLIVLKNRLYKLGKNRKIIIGYDDDKMRHFDVNQSDIVSSEDVPKQKKPNVKDIFENFNFGK